VEGWTTWWAPRPAKPAVESWQDFQASCAWLLGLQLLDLLTTLAALAHGAAESNPFAAALLESAGPVALLRLKLVALVLMVGWGPAYAMVQASGATARRSRASWTALGLVVALVLFYSGVVVNNLAVLSAHLRA
jgi:hypothetical protein